LATMIGCMPTQALAFLAVFVYATHAMQAIAFEWKPGFFETAPVYPSRRCTQGCVVLFQIKYQKNPPNRLSSVTDETKPDWWIERWWHYTPAWMSNCQ